MDLQKVKWLAIPGTLVAVITLWGSLGFPTIATGEEVKTAKCLALENRLTLLLAFPPDVKNTVAWQNWERVRASTQRQINNEC